MGCLMNSWKPSGSRPMSSSYQPIRCKYSRSVINVDQSEVSIHVTWTVLTNKRPVLHTWHQPTISIISLRSFSLAFSRSETGNKVSLLNKSFTSIFRNIQERLGRWWMRSQYLRSCHPDTGIWASSWLCTPWRSVCSSPAWPIRSEYWPMRTQYQYWPKRSDGNNVNVVIWKVTNVKIDQWAANFEFWPIRSQHYLTLTSPAPPRPPDLPRPRPLETDTESKLPFWKIYIFG